jgi:hypothetical protein
MSQFDEGDLRLAREFAAVIRARHPVIPRGQVLTAIHDLFAEALGPASTGDVASAMAALAKQAGFRGSGEIELPPRGTTRRPPKKR